MPIAKKAILDSHAVAKETEDRIYAALCHAIGHYGATVHVETHAIGLPFYELTAIVMECGYNNYQDAEVCWSIFTEINRHRRFFCWKPDAFCFIYDYLGNII